MNETKPQAPKPEQTLASLIYLILVGLAIYSFWQSIMLQNKAMDLLDELVKH